LLAPRLVSLLFERGRFGAESTLTVSAILSGFFPALVAWSVMDILGRSLFSLGKARAPLAAAGLGLLVNACVSGAAPIASVRWVGLGANAGFIAGALVLARHLRGLGRSGS
jgi:putative peptidoglycan lipid II flippase